MLFFLGFTYAALFDLLKVFDITQRGITLVLFTSDVTK